MYFGVFSQPLIMALSLKVHLTLFNSVYYFYNLKNGWLLTKSLEVLEQQL